MKEMKTAVGKYEIIKVLKSRTFEKLLFVIDVETHQRQELEMTEYTMKTLVDKGGLQAFTLDYNDTTAELHHTSFYSKCENVFIDTGAQVTTQLKMRSTGMVALLVSMRLSNMRVVNTSDDFGIHNSMEFKTTNFKEMDKLADMFITIGNGIKQALKSKMEP